MAGEVFQQKNVIINYTMVMGRVTEVREDFVRLFTVTFQRHDDEG